MRLIFNENGPEETDDDLLHLLKKLSSEKEKIPILYQCCGTEDFLYNDNVKFKSKCKYLGINVIYEEETGTHEWGYWDRKIQSFLEKLPLNKG